MRDITAATSLPTASSFQPSTASKPIISISSYHEKRQTQLHNLSLKSAKNNTIVGSVI